VSNETDAPEVLETEWDFEQVNALFDDLQQAAQIDHVQVRTASGDGPNDRAVTLRDAYTLLNSRDAKAIQIRYRFGGQTWCDTLMVGRESVRIIRATVAQNEA
jgi:hypothetical protein